MSVEASKPSAVVVFRNDDLAATSDLAHEERLAAIFERYGVPQTMGVIPRCAIGSMRDPSARGEAALGENPGIVRFLRGYVSRSGSEVALHGYTHRTNQLSIPSRREFFEFRRLSAEQQEGMIREGTDLIEHALGARPVSFVPPWNRLDEATLVALARNGYRIVSAGAFTPSGHGLTPLGTNSDIHRFPLQLGTALAAGRRPFLVVMFHSRTVRDPAEIRLLEQAVRLAAETPGLLAVTLREAVERFPEETRLLNEAGRNVVSPDEVLGSERARSLVYWRVLATLGSARELERRRAAAARAYDEGDYESVAALSPRVEQDSRRLLRRGRAVGVVSGFAGGLALAAVWHAVRLPAPGPFLAAIWLVGAGVGVLVRDLFTAPETRREAGLALTLAAAAAGLALLGGYAIGAGLP